MFPLICAEQALAATTCAQLCALRLNHHVRFPSYGTRPVPHTNDEFMSGPALVVRHSRSLSAMEQQNLRDAARLSLGKSRQFRKVINEKSDDLKYSLRDSTRQQNANLTARLEEIENLLKQLRLACMEVIFYDFEYAHGKDVESALWSAHVVVNTEFRRVVTYVNAQNQVVLKRKVDKLYREFLKTSQFFYRGYIQRLSGQFYIPELQQVARGLQVDPFVPPQQDPAPTASLRTKLVGSCYLTLVRMGDLARYRCQNTEKPPKSSLDIALTYYGLARMLDPDDGASYHQTAVLYQPSANQLEIVYYFLRSVCVAKPHKLGVTNLERAFSSLLANQSGSKGSSRNATNRDHSEALTTWFLKLHAYYSQGVIFSAQDELEKEVLHRLEVCLKTPGNEELVFKMLLASIAACNFAFENIQDTKDWTIERSRSCQYLLLFQVRVAAILFRLFRSIVQDNAIGSTDHVQDTNDATFKSTIDLSASVARLLPLVRIYLAWIYVSREDLNRYQEWLEPSIRELYGLLADILTLLLPHAASNGDVIDSKYLLPEDVEVLGLKTFSDRKLPLFLEVQIIPKQDPPKCRKIRKPRKDALGIEHSAQTESIWRIRDILCCGIYLAGSTKSPLTITTTIENVDVWVYDKDGPLKSIDETKMTRLFAQVKMTAHKVSATTDDRLELDVADPESPAASTSLPQPGVPSTLYPRDEQKPLPNPGSMEFPGRSFGNRDSKLDYDDDMSADLNMAGMVDKLVDEGADEVRAQSGTTHGDTSYGMNSSVANDVFGNLMPSPVSRAPPTMAPVAPNGKAIPNLPWNYFYSPLPIKESGANPSVGDGLDVPRSVSGQIRSSSIGAEKQSLNFANYNNTAGIHGGPFSVYGSQLGYRATEVAPVPVPAPAAPPAPVDLNGPTSLSDQRAAALDNLKSALFAQYGTGATSTMQSPPYAYGQTVYADQKDASRSDQGHRARMSISSPLANVQSPASLEHDRKRVSQSFMDLQIGRPQSGATSQSPISRAMDMRNGAHHQATSPTNRMYDFARSDHQGIGYNGSNGSSGAGDTAFTQQAPAFPGSGSSLAFSNASSIWAGTPAVPEVPRGTVACNGNFFNATTAFGRSGNVNNRDDPTHFRNRLQELGAGVGESVAAYDRAVLESALADTTNTRSRPQ
ncbi:Protein SMG7 [Seiridium cupressi]